MKQFRKMPGAFIAAAAVLLTGTATAQTDSGGAARYTSWWLPGSASTSVEPVDHLFNLILWITSIVFVLVFVLLLYFLFRYRYKENRRAIYSHGNNRLEIIWTIVPALIVLWLGIISQSVWSEIKSEVPASPDLVIDVKPRQFQWDVSYVGADGKLGTSDDITTINQVYVPLGKTVLVNLTAQDVIHSFFVPEFRMKQDAVPGMVTRMWFTTTQVGKYEIACAELCGLGHGRMKGFMNIMEPAAFDKWYADQQAEKAKQLAPPAAAAPASGASGDSTAAPASADTTAAAPTADTAAKPSNAGTTDTAARP